MVVSEINSAVQTEIIESLIEKLHDNYVFPEVAETICESLSIHLENGDYADISEGSFFALALTEHLQEINQDEHLWVRYYPEPLPDHQGSMLQNAERITEFRQKGILENYGFHKLERLPGNIGYMDIRYFYRPTWGSGDTAVAAMNFLANTNALIIDLRKCTGGNAGMVALISSYFFQGEPTLLNSLYWRDEDFTQQYWTLPYVPGKSYGDKPVYLLLSNTTFSAAEEFAYNLQTRQRATLVGLKTGGGAHPGSPFRLHPHFEAFIPIGRAINPVKNDNWEGRGVIPDIPVPQENALDTAYKMVLKSVIEDMGGSSSRPTNQLLKEAQDALEVLNNQ
jgi:hypothetical protein